MQPSKDYSYKVNPTSLSRCQLSDCIHEVQQVRQELMSKKLDCAPEIARLADIEHAYVSKNSVLNFVTDDQLKKIEVYIGDGSIDCSEDVFAWGLETIEGMRKGERES